MQCPECKFDNPDEAKFCNECGSSQKMLCPSCNNLNPPNSKFCNECGGKLQMLERNAETAATFVNHFNPTPQTIEFDDLTLSVGERRHVTVLFSDLTGYTAMSEKLDPEDVKEITSRIFREISMIVAGYDGFIEKYAGDAVLAIFGLPLAHEDDPIRAIKAARAIHRAVDAISPDVEKMIGQSILMHSGINTGLVVTGEVNLERGTHGVAGDTINLAARLSSLAKPGEILVNVDTCRQAEGHFECKFYETATVKGKAEPVEVHKVLAEREAPVTIRRLSGLRADLVGRSMEIAELYEAVENLKQGKGHIFSICGAAGTGKSRLVEEFKDGLDLQEVQWIECHAYAFSQDIPYFPLVDLINRLLKIEEKDPASKVREKVERGLSSFIGARDDVIPYIGGLYSLHYSQLEDVSPELWKTRLQEAILTILSGLAEIAPTVFFIEDLHWSDPSFVELLRRACLEIRQPALLLCTYRPTFTLFKGHQLNSIGGYYHELKLDNLSLSTAQQMLASLLKTENIPPDLKRWANSKAEGNPFYLEELINSLTESDTLKEDNGQWRLTRSLTESDIPSTLHGLINGRLDRLEKQTKRILQEASVIGRDFLYEILRRITELEERIDGELYHLERLDLIRIRSLQPEIEYMFKHALTQEVVYNSVLKKERRVIHEQIARVIETIFTDRLSEFNETLAYHFARGQSTAKAVDYLVKSGEKSLARYAVEEAHEYFKKAYDILYSAEELSKTNDIILIDLLNSWAYAFYYLGKFEKFIELFKLHQKTAESLGDNTKIGMFYAWLGIAEYMAGSPAVSYKYLCKGMELGEKTNNKKVIGYACAWLTYTCGELGAFAEGIRYGERAQKIAKSFPADQYLFFKSLGGLCLIHYFQGDTDKIFEGAKRLIEHGESNANSRSKVFGFWFKAFGHLAKGDAKSAQKNSEMALQITRDPFYTMFPLLTLGFAHFFNNQLREAEKSIKSYIGYSEKHGIGQFTVIGQVFLAPVLIAEGRMQQGHKLMTTAREVLISKQRKPSLAISEYILGEINLQIATGPKPSLSIMAKNLGFMIKNVPSAGKKAETHFLRAVELFKEMEMKSYLGLTYMSLGLLYKARKKTVQARQYISDSIQIFKECEAQGYLNRANAELGSLPKR